MMQYIKKAVVCCCILLLFVGCGGSESISPMAYPFSCLVTIEQDDLIVTGERSAHLIGYHTFEITEPTVLQGLTFACQNGQTTITWEEWLSPQTVSLPQTALFEEIVAALDGAVRWEGTPVITQTTAVTSFGGHTVEWDRHSGKPLAIALASGSVIRLDCEK